MKVRAKGGNREGKKAGGTGASAVFLLLLAAVLLGFFLLSAGAAGFIKGEIHIVQDDPAEYGGFPEFRGYSGLSIFPENPGDAAENYYYEYEDTLFDPACQIYLSCVYEKEAYEAERERLSSLSASYRGRVQTVFLDDLNFPAPAYVTIDGNDHCYEYALLLPDNRIDYVFLQFIKKSEVCFDPSLLPDYYEDESRRAGERSPALHPRSREGGWEQELWEKNGYSMYLFYDRDGNGVRIGREDKTGNAGQEGRQD